MFGQRITTAIVLVLFCGISASPAIGGTPSVFVNADCGSDAWSGKFSQCSAPDGPKQTIQAAIDAIPGGGVIAASEGTYSGHGNRDLDFKGKPVSLIGNGPQSCIIDCGGTSSQNHRALNFHSGEGENTIVQGFTIRGGVAYKGGAVLCTNSSPKFVNCVFHANQATDDDTGGGAIYNENSSPTLIDCLFTDNQAMPTASYGGAITNDHSSPTLTNCTFINNKAWSGGGVFNTENSNPVLENCTFTSNSAHRGGGMTNWQSSPTLSRCTFTGNSVSYYGGGMRNLQSNPLVTHCTFMDNSARSGGGMHNGSSGPAIINCVFNANSATGHGGAISNDKSTSAIINCTLTGNSGAHGGAIASFDYSSVTVTNSILWANSPTQVYHDDPACIQISFSCIGGGWGGPGNIAGSPLFEDADGPDNVPGTEDDNLSLTSGSPCIDAGNNSAVPPLLLTDLSGHGRLADDPHTADTGSGAPPIVDMGAYEHHPAAPRTIYVDDSAEGANNGSSWADAFNYLQDALEVAADDDEIRVAQGTYKPDQGDDVSTGDRAAAFHLKGSLLVKGGYAGFGQPDPDERDIHRFQTILSGDLSGNDVEVPEPHDLLNEPTRSENSSRIVTVIRDYPLADSPLLEGFTITGANGTALFLYHDDAIITDCTFISNSGYHGAAMDSENSRAIFTRCSFIKNAAGEYGGAIYIDGCETCRSMYGAFTDCVFINNYAGSCGGAIYSKSCTLVTGINCLFVGNTAVSAGAALYDSTYFGSHLVNCTLSGNNSIAVYIDEYGSATLTNCILWNNLRGTGTGLRAQISWQDEEQPPTINYSCIEGWDGSLGGVGNFSADPCFISPGSWDIDLNFTPGDYHLKPDSPSLNAGDPDYVAEPTDIEIPPGYYFPGEIDPHDYIADSSEKDLDANPRVVRGRVDMGPYELHIPALVAHWKLDEAEGDIARDSVGTNDGSLHGNPQWQPLGGRLEGALLFDGENDYVNCGDSSVFDITAQISVAAWVNINAVNMDWQTVIAKGDSAWRLSTAEDEMRYHFAVTGGPPWNYINGDIEVEAGEWHHVCGTYDGANLRLYIDGLEDPAGPIPELNGVTTDNYDVLIGENQERPNRHWDGAIDDLRIFNYALSPLQVFHLCKPTTLYVDADAPGANNGSSWTDAFNTLQDALAAAVSGTEIRVAQGTYKPDQGAGITPGNREATFHLINGATIKGGYAGYGYPNPDTCNIGTCKTILSGDLLGDDPEHADPCDLQNDPARAENSYHVVTASGTDRTAILDGVTIVGGNAEWDAGAGMYNSAGSPTLNNCTFADNLAEYGGGMYNSDDSSPLLTNCIFNGNAAFDEEGTAGGGMYNDHSSPILINCTFTRNWADVGIPDHGGGDGGGMYNSQSSPILTDCAFSKNSALCAGGGMANAYESAPTITNCTFTANSALGRWDHWGEGGAMYNDYANPILTNCAFVANTALEGGAIYNRYSESVYTNCRFSGNTAQISGGALYDTSISSVTLTNCTLAGNAAPVGRALACYSYYPEYAPNLQITNCIIWNGDNAILNDEDSTITITYSDVQNGWPGLGNIDTDPRFASAGYWNDDDSWVNGDFHLKSLGWRWNAEYEDWDFDRVTSRCIDAGNPGAPLRDEPLSVPNDPNNDYGENLRINMGAYGGTPEASIPPYDWALLGDLTNDGTANWLDFAYTASRCSVTADEQPVDLNRDGLANLADAALLFDDWLKTTIWHE